MAQMGPESMSVNKLASTLLAGGSGVAHTLDQAVEERLALEVSIVSLEVLLGGSDELDGGKLVAVSC